MALMRWQELAGASQHGRMIGDVPFDFYMFSHETDHISYYLELKYITAFTTYLLENSTKS